MPSTARPIKPMPHELAYLALWATLGAAFLFTGRATAFELILPFQAALLFLLIAKARSGWAWQARLWFPVVAINLTYYWLGKGIPRLRDWRADAALSAIDRWCFGDCLAAKISPFIQGWSRDVLSGAYLLYFPLWTGLLIYAWRRGGTHQKACFSGLALVHAIGFAGYALVPAAGPFCYEPIAKTLSAAGGWLTQLNAGIVHRGCNGVDVFPSLHTANTLFVLLTVRSFSKKAFWILALPCALVISATIGLQYHYVADVAAGAVLGTTVWAFTTRRALKRENVPV